MVTPSAGSSAAAAMSKAASGSSMPEAQAASKSASARPWSFFRLQEELLDVYIYRR